MRALILACLLSLPSPVVMGSGDRAICFVGATPAEVRRVFEQDVRRAQAIFVGLVEAASPDSATFKVTRVWKGDLGPSLTLLGPKASRPDGTSAWRSEAASDFAIGQSYLVFAFGDSLATARPSICHTMLESASASMQAELSSIRKPYDPKR